MERSPRLVVVGQVARDLVLQVGRLPGPGAATDVEQRLEVLGGKGANQGVALAQLGASVALVGVVGDDEAGRGVLDQAAQDGLDVTGVTRRAGGTTALLVDVVEADGTRRLLEHVPGEVLLTADDVTAAGERVLAADTVVVQLQQPVPAALAALGLARGAGLRTVVDGAPEGGAADRQRVLGQADVVRADAHEAELLVGRELRSLDDTVRAAEDLLDTGPSVVALAAGDAGNVVAWRGGHEVLPLLDVPTVDPTGAGDAFVAGLALSLTLGLPPRHAGRRAAAAASLSVSRLGGRPALAPAAVDQQVSRYGS